MEMNSDVYDAENATEEAFMLMGRVNALAAYLQRLPPDSEVPRELCAAILGITLEIPFQSYKE